MKAEISYTDQHGITTCLSLTALSTSLEQLSICSKDEFSVSHLVDTFEKSLLEMPKELLRVHQELCSNLLSVSCEVLQ